jgi:hypothetical protein
LLAALGNEACAAEMRLLPLDELAVELMALLDVVDRFAGEESRTSFPALALLRLAAKRREVRGPVPGTARPPAGDEARAALTLPAWPESAGASRFLQRVHGVSAALLAHIAELAFGTELGPSTDGGGG